MVSISRRSFENVITGALDIKGIAIALSDYDAEPLTSGLKNLIPKMFCICWHDGIDHIMQVHEFE